MIEELLSRLERGGVLTVDRMADELGVTPALVAQMIDHLVRAGRVKPLGACEAVCSGCPLAGACKPAHGRVWQSAD